MQYKFKLLETALRETAQARENTKKEVKKLREQNSTYAQEYIESKEKQLLGELGSLQQKKYEEVSDLLRGMERLAEEKHNELNLDSIELQNALKIIELSGSQLTGETAKSINSKLKESFPVLQALQTIYETQGIAYNGGLEELSYSIPETFNNLRKRAEEAFVQGGSLNQLSSSISKVGKVEGFEFPSMVDNEGFVQTMRESAGLQ